MIQYDSISYTDCLYIRIMFIIMKKNYFLYIGILLLFNSCLSNTGDEKIRVVNQQIQEPTDTIKGRVVPIDSTKMAFRLSCINDYLIITNQTEPLFSVMNSEDSVISQFGTIGHANNEFNSPPNSVYCKENADGELLMYVPTETQTKIINLTKSIKQNKTIIEEIRKDGMQNVGDHVYIDAPNRKFTYKPISFKGDVRDHDFLPANLTDIKGKETEILYSNPLTIIGERDLVMTINVTSFNAKPDLSKFVELGLFMDYISIINVPDKSSKIIRFNDNDIEKLEKICTHGSYDQVVNDLVVRNIFSCVSDDYIFVLYDGVHSPVAMDNIIYEPGMFTPTIRILDWEGNYLSSFILREPITVIAYNETANTLYGLDANFSLYKYDISKYLKK